MAIPQQTLVSVILPFLNGSHWLVEAVESVISQTFLNWELIIVDDGSEEEHSRIAIDYSIRYPEKIIYTYHAEHVNRGVTISRNHGVRLAQGKYIAFLDSDDCWLPKKLESQLALFHQYPDAGMVCEASIFWYSWGKSLNEDVIVPVGTAGERLYDPPTLVYNLYPLGIGAPPCPSSIMIKKNIFDHYGGFEEVFSGINELYEDQALLSKIYLHEKVFVSGSANNLYRKRPGSMSEAVNDKKLYFHGRRFFLNWLESYLKEHFIKNERILQLIDQARKDMQD